MKYEIGSIVAFSEQSIQTNWYKSGLEKRFKNVALKVVSMKAGARQTIVFKLKTLNNVLVYSKNADSQPDDTFLECHIRPLIAIEYARLVKIHEI